MFRTTLLATSCALIIGSAAFAQTNETVEPASPPAASTTQPGTTQPAELPVSSKNMFGNPPAEAAKDTAKVGFVEPKVGQLLVSSFIGRSVYESDAADANSVGKLNDLIISPEGQIDAAVIGVGGFLGLGEKDVAVSPDVLLLSIRSDGKTWLVIKATKDELTNAAAFDRSAFFADGVADPNAAKTSNATKGDVPMPLEPAPAAQ